ncbi:tRNA (5-methylaminomethyl-2-thiouridine)(34)-methyltransferase MnmD [Pseudofulvibacter geojedonensis]|uniref:tRNA (5-methylaminomethyl-2-thiouridine)(34)-methyltransferase MnmD n=1 Tax=Pseudofulvibacter geojedonensis TaxID=1123758 RepID=A0ABW3I1Y9_9FLAO
MKREVIITSDGSTTIHLPDWDEQYHSKHGAIQEAYHVFIRKGLDLFSDKVCILEIGFGTGLNAFISYLESTKRNLDINYTGIEAYPIALDEVNKLNYANELNAQEANKVFKKIHSVSWEEKHLVSENFCILKRQQFFKDIKDKNAFDLIYFDAFGARVQPELWTEEVFEIMYTALKEKGVLVTYAAKGSVRRAMQAVGFTVERLEGPPGKREMLRATKKVV